MPAKSVLIYTDRAFCASQNSYIDMLAPFWADPRENPHFPGMKILDNYYAIASTLFKITSDPKEAMFAVLPDDWKRYRKNKQELKAKAFCDYASKAGLKTLVFCHTDSDEKIPLQNTVIFRTSLNKGQRSNEFALPAWTGDLLCYYKEKEIILRNKKKIPTIGFCGNAHYQRPTFINKLIPILIKFSTFRFKNTFPTSKFRFKIIKALNKNEEKGNFKTNFVIRDKYLGGYHYHKNINALLKNRKEYYLNLSESDLTLCLRGGGNFSYRFYETLSVGRIPLFINTKCQLPFDNWIDYKKHTCWVDQNQVSEIDILINKFWKELDENKFQAMQVSNRMLWKDYLSPEGFFSKLSDFLIETTLHIE